jgi:hypothetical protein
VLCIKLDVVVGEWGEYMAIGHVFVHAPLSTSQSTFYFIIFLRRFTMNIGEHSEWGGRGNRGGQADGGPVARFVLN